MELFSILIRNLTDLNEELTYSQFNKTFYARDQTSKKVSVHQNVLFKNKLNIFITDTGRRQQVYGCFNIYTPLPI